MILMLTGIPDQSKIRLFTNQIISYYDGEEHTVVNTTMGRIYVKETAEELDKLFQDTYFYVKKNY